MTMNYDAPILEFDEAENAIIDPEDFVKTAGTFSCDKVIMTFFPEVMEKLKSDGTIMHEKTIDGENPLTVYRFADSDVLIVLGEVGCPACAGDLDLFHAMGVKKVMFCGGGGVLDRDIAVGRVLVVEGAIRDEGFSYHYLKPSRYVYTDEKVTEKIAEHLDKKNVPYIKGLTWTTDAIFRETAGKVAKRRAEGAKIVEMEQAGCIAVAKYRGFDYGALIYGGDDVSGGEWDNRSWRSRDGVRYDLVMMCRELVDLI
ncbi:MAG: nucleoside phosphorylase [Clostridia bacterium]|nr:nucleoside phosphorylase [Clostridia bacterium]